jgi:hypothetical protein
MKPDPGSWFEHDQALKQRHRFIDQTSAQKSERCRTQARLIIGAKHERGQDRVEIAVEAVRLAA